MTTRRTLVAGLVAAAALAVTGSNAPAGSSGTAQASAVPVGFEDTLVTTVSGPMDVTWTPDGRMIIITKSGQVRVFANGVLLSTPALDLSARVCTVGEQGLTGVTVHPDFATNHFVYLYYIVDKFNAGCPESAVNGPVGRLSRFVLPDTNVIDPASELVLFDTPPRYKNHHTGGDPKFGKDGLVYVTVGDAGGQSLGWPQDLGTLHGKVVRITDSGGIPSGNPHTGSGTARCNLDGVPPAGSPAGTKCQEIWASGLRNPFRLAMDPNAAGVRFYVNDVGQHTWEEISEGQGHTGGANYGWQLREGPCAKDSDTDCGPPPSGMTDPVHWYHHGVNGGAATGGAFVPNGVWPASFDGAYLFADYVFGKIYQLVPNAGGCRLCLPPTSSFDQNEFASIAQVVSMRFGPDQALYYVTRNGSEIHRIAATGGGNRAPAASATANPTAGALPLQVQFDGSASSDPDSDPLTYEWDFEGDGNPDSSAVQPSHTYTTAGVYVATLTVRDGRGGQSSTTVRIDAGNVAPVPAIETPTDGTLAAVGDTFVLHGSATDEGASLPNAALTWETELVHATHTHPLMPPTIGNDIQITYPEPEDLDAAKDSYLRIRLTATDPQGLSQSVTRDLRPKLVDLTFGTQPAGLQVVAGGLTITGPTTVRSWEKYNATVYAPDQADASGRQWLFDSWSDGGSQSHTVSTPASATTYTAVFRAAPSQTLTFGPTDDATVKAGSPTTSFGSATAVSTDNSPVEHFLLRFAVNGVAGRTVESAKLRIYCINSSGAGGDFRALSDPAANWNESTVTWNNAPSGAPGIVASLGTVAVGSWYEIDVTSIVTADGPVSLRVTSPSSNGADYSSKEGASGFAPQLVVTVGGPPDTTNPSDPTGLQLVTATSTQVDIGWTASTDNVGVTGYEVFRDGAFLATTGAVTSYSDASASPSTTYSYTVRARDAAGNVSGPSNALVVTTGPPVPILTFAPTDDTYVRADRATRNYGTTTSMSTDNSPVKDLLIKFTVAGVGSRSVASATLRLYCLDGSDSGGVFHGLADPLAIWSEASVTWNSAPPAATAGVASLGRVLAGTWYEIDVTSLVSGDGTISLRVRSPSSNGADFATKERAGFAPSLVVTMR